MPAWNASAQQQMRFVKSADHLKIFIEQAGRKQDEFAFVFLSGQPRANSKQFRIKSTCVLRDSIKFNVNETGRAT